MITWILNQLILAAYNRLNVYVDAYKIKLAIKENRAKAIKHGINGACYLAFIALLSYLFHMSVWGIVVFSISGFCNRQFSFGIPLNLRRGLKWDYVTTAKKPWAITDRIQIWLFGRDGRKPFLLYGTIWIICLLIKWIWL